jgi:hypothetical protein
MSDFKPYLEVSEEVLIRFRTDLPGMSLIREGLLALASDPIGLDEDDPWSAPRDAEELLVAMPSGTGTRRSPEARLRATITSRRQAAKRSAEEAVEMALVIGRLEAEHPDLVAAARTDVASSRSSVSDEKLEPFDLPPAPSAPPVEPKPAAS